MSDLIDRAAIMAGPPQAPPQGAPPVIDLSPGALGRLAFMGGIMWVGGKLASHLWSALGLDKKPRKKRRIASEDLGEPEAIDEPEEDEPEEDEDDSEEDPGEDEEPEE
jgi:hypothetical protein